MKTALRRLLQHDALNFTLTNRLPRLTVTRWMGRFSKIHSPWLCRASIAVWRLFTDLDLSDAKQQRFASLHDCFTRELKAGARPVDVDPAVIVSPCDAIVGACGSVHRGSALQAKGMPYRLPELFGCGAGAVPFEGGTYVTLRLTSSMYHRFHAPHAGHIHHVSYIGGDTWNVNPAALQRVPRLDCRNERATILMTLADGAATPLALVPVAAILVASIRLHFLNVLLHVRWPGANELPCDARVAKGQELGWFEHGSTIIVFAPAGVTLAADIAPGSRIRMGQALMRLPQRRCAVTALPHGCNASVAEAADDRSHDAA